MVQIQSISYLKSFTDNTLFQVPISSFKVYYSFFYLPNPINDIDFVAFASIVTIALLISFNVI